MSNKVPTKNHRVTRRRVTSVRILPLQEVPFDCASLKKAISFIACYDENQLPIGIVKYEVQVRYNNGDRIEGEFESKVAAIQFFRSFVSSL